MSDHTFTNQRIPSELMKKPRLNFSSALLAGVWGTKATATHGGVDDDGVVFVAVGDGADGALLRFEQVSRGAHPAAERVQLLDEVLRLHHLVRQDALLLRQAPSHLRAQKESQSFPRAFHCSLPEIGIQVSLCALKLLL